MAKIYIDPGHGGHDGGASGSGLREKDWVLEVSLELARILKQAGHSVKLSRSTDKFIGLTARTNDANRWGADIFISIHFNAGGGFGWEDFIFNGNVSNNTRKLQNDIHDAIKPVLSKHGLKNRGKKRANFAVLRQSRMPAILIEGGFVDTTDNQVLKKASYKKDLAVGLANGVQKYFGLGAVSKPSKSNWTKASGNWTGQTLRQGQYGEPVKQLQEMLASKHYYPNKGAKNNGIDSYFGADTKDAVERYQSMHGLTVDGLAGKGTYSSLGGKETSTPAKSGWKTESGKQYYYKSGKKQTGWLKDDGRWFYLNTDGSMHTGLLEDKGKFYFMNLGGRMTEDQFFTLFANKKGEVYYKKKD